MRAQNQGRAEERLRSGGASGAARGLGAAGVQGGPPGGGTGADRDQEYSAHGAQGGGRKVTERGARPAHSTDPAVGREKRAGRGGAAGARGPLRAGPPAGRPGRTAAASTFPGELSARLPLQELVPERVHAAALRPVPRRRLRQLHLPEPQAGLPQRPRARARRRARRPQAHRAARLPAPQLGPRPHDQQLRRGPSRRGRHHHAEADPHGGGSRRTRTPSAGRRADWAARAAGTRARLRLFGRRPGRACGRGAGEPARPGAPRAPLLRAAAGDAARGRKGKKTGQAKGRNSSPAPRFSCHLSRSLEIIFMRVTQKRGVIQKSSLHSSDVGERSWTGYLEACGP